MALNRRKFIQTSGAALAASALPDALWAKTTSEPSSHLSILQGATDSTQTQFSIILKRDQWSSSSSGSGQISVANLSSKKTSTIPPQWLKVHQRAFSNDVVIHLQFGGLEIGEKYQLTVKSDKGVTLDQREFQTIDTNSNQFKFALCSCMMDFMHRADIWATLSSRAPDAIFFIGDSVYADRTEESKAPADPVQLWNRFVETRQKLDIYKHKKLIPILATWDDHDYGINDGDSSYIYKKESQENFQQFFAQTDSTMTNLVRGPGVSSILKYGKILVALMDNRSFREPDGATSRYAHWGETQELWLQQHLKSHRGLAFVASGSQFFPTTRRKESFAGNHEYNFKEWLKSLKELKARVVFLSGDVHFSEVAKIEAEPLGYETYEITSSSMHSLTFAALPRLMKNPRRISSTWKYNFVIVNSDTSTAETKIAVESIGASNQSLFSHQLKIAP